jgi:hypothetical protein
MTSKVLIECKNGTYHTVRTFKPKHLYSVLREFTGMYPGRCISVDVDHDVIIQL